MSDLEPRGPSRLSRRQREQRAYVLVLSTFGLAALTVVCVVLAVAGAIGGGVPFLTAILAVISWLLLRRTLAGR
jgi:hypothetical protein